MHRDTWAGDTCIVSRHKYRDTKKKKKKILNICHTWLLALFCPFCCPHTAWIVLCIFYCAIQGHFWLIIKCPFSSVHCANHALFLQFTALKCPFQIAPCPFENLGRTLDTYRNITNGALSYVTTCIAIQGPM